MKKHKTRSPKPNEHSLPLRGLFLYSGRLLRQREVRATLRHGLALAMLFLFLTAGMFPLALALGGVNRFLLLRFGLPLTLLLNALAAALPACLFALPLFRGLFAYALRCVRGDAQDLSPLLAFYLVGERHRLVWRRALALSLRLLLLPGLVQGAVLLLRSRAFERFCLQIIGVSPPLWLLNLPYARGVLIGLTLAVTLFVLLRFRVRGYWITALLYRDPTLGYRAACRRSARLCRGRRRQILSLMLRHAPREGLVLLTGGLFAAWLLPRPMLERAVFTRRYGFGEGLCEPLA